MKIEEVKSSLETIIIRLKEAEKGYQEIAKATVIPEINKMVTLYAKERKYMYSNLERHLEDLGGNPEELGTSFASALHRAWIDLKINGWGDSFTQVVDEIETGSQVLIDEYQIVLDNTNLHARLRMVLTSQQEKINLELNQLRQYREKVIASNT